VGDDSEVSSIGKLYTAGNDQRKREKKGVGGGVLRRKMNISFQTLNKSSYKIHSSQPNLLWDIVAPNTGE
jgi:hypothetical protein